SSRDGLTCKRGSAVMATSCSTFSDEIDGILIELSASLERAQRVAFVDAARAALAGVLGLGPGAAYRLLVPLQRAYWDPPPDDMRREGARHLGPSKLQNLPGVGADDPRTGARDRHRFRAVG